MKGCLNLEPVLRRGLLHHSHLTYGSESRGILEKSKPEHLQHWEQELAIGEEEGDVWTGWLSGDHQPSSQPFPELCSQVLLALGLHQPLRSGLRA